VRVAGKVAIITGAASGIGRASAILFAGEGAKVVIADMNDTGGEETVASIEKNGGEAVFVRTDVSIASQVNNLIDKAVIRFGKIDILFNNAGILGDSVRIEDIDESSWDKIMAVNVKGMFLATKYALPVMKKAGAGVIINTASMAAFRPLPMSCAYSVSKGAVITFTRESAVELAEYNIRVNSIAPFITDTPLLPQMAPPGVDPEDFKKRIASSTPLLRLIKPEDVAHAALYLASDESAMLTGGCINVDGGRGI